MKPKIMSQYIFLELIPPFVFGLAVFIFIVLMSQVLRLNELIILHGVPFIQVAKMVIYLISSFLAISLPIAFLFAILMVYGRLSTDNELTAFKAAGFSLWQFLKPPLAFSILIFIACLFVTIHLETWAYGAFKKLLINIGQKTASVAIKEGVFNEDFFGVVLYCDKSYPKDGRIENVLLFNEKNPEAPISVIAKEGYVRPFPNSEATLLRLVNGNIHRLSKDFNSYQRIDFQTYDINLKLETLRTKEVSEKPMYITFKRLLEKIKEFPPGSKKALPYLVELHRKFAIAFASIVLTLLGVAMAIKPSRTIRTQAFAITGILVGVYWFLYVEGRSLAAKGIISPFIAAWTPNLLFLALSLYLMRKKSYY